MIKKDYLPLIVILFVATFLRFWQITSVPPSLSWDEAALGYNAFSILQTGKDEYGQTLPLIFKSFGDFKPGLDVYLTVPFVAIFGLTEFAVRAASSVFGVLSVLVLYLLVRDWTQKKNFAIASAFILAISPWHLVISRPALEVSVAIFFNLLAIYFFLKFFTGKRLYLLVSCLLLLASLYTYHGSKIAVLAILAGILIFSFKKLVATSKKYLILAAIILLLSLPVYLGAGGRGEVFSIFSYPRTPQETAKIKSQDNGNEFQFAIFHSEQLNFARSILTRYFNHFSAKFLFFEGDFQNKRTQIPAMGLLYFFELPLILLGTFWLVRKKLEGKSFLWYFLAISPIPAAITRDLVHPIRAANMLIPLAVLSGFGLAYLLELVGKFKKYSKLILVLIAAILLWNFAYFFDLYFHHSKIANSKDWVYGTKVAVQFIEGNYEKYDQIIMTTAYNEPYIFNLFYSKYDPSKYQKQAKLELVRGPVDVGEVPGYDKFSFRPIYWPSDRGLAKTLFVGAPQELPISDLVRDEKLGIAKVLTEIKFLNGETAFKIVERL